MKDIYYSTNSFNWEKYRNTFIGYADKIYDIASNHYYQLAFPSGRSKFYIKNETSGGFRRFIYHREYPISETERIWIFKSEDDIYCEVITKI